VDVREHRRPRDSAQSRLSCFTAEVVRVIAAIPKGRVISYGQVARRAGSPNGARQVVRVLHTQSDRFGLPWHRVVSRDGRIALARGRGYEIQLRLLKREGVEPGPDGRIDLKRFGCVLSVVRALGPGGEV